MDKMVERIVESNKDEEIRDLIIRQKKDEFVRRLADAALKKTEEESLKRGREQGRLEEKVAIAKTLLGIQMSLEDIAKITGLSLDEIKKLV